MLDRLKQLSGRERRFLLWGGGAAVLILFYGGVELGFGYADRMQELERLTTKKQEDARALSALAQEFRVKSAAVRQVEAKIERDKGAFSLLAFLETTAANTDLRSRIAHIRPQPASVTEGYRETAVEIKIDNVTLEQVVRLLAAIEGAPHFIKMKNLRLRTRFADKRFLDATLLVSTYEKV